MKIGLSPEQKEKDSYYPGFMTTGNYFFIGKPKKCLGDVKVGKYIIAFLLFFLLFVSIFEMARSQNEKNQKEEKHIMLLA
jgi:hypothetical protein